jgi:succinate dehydrogenase/fumarate reductase flavoprotein subunit
MVGQCFLCFLQLLLIYAVNEDAKIAMVDDKRVSENKLASRRDFLIAAGALISADALSVPAAAINPKTQTAPAQTKRPTKSSATEPWLPEKWDHEADVAVVGYGGAGACAAITASDAGAKVIIMEKAPYRGGGNTGICMGICVCPTNVQHAVEYLKAASEDYTPLDAMIAWAEEACKNRAFYDGLGIKYTEYKSYAGYPTLPYYSSMPIIQMAGMGAGLFTELDKRVRNRNIQILFGTPGKELIQNPITKEILGVYGQEISGTWGKEKKGRIVAVKARRGVVLTTGGFEHNEEMKRQFHKAYPTAFYGWRYNTGDGVKMAQSVGADLWHMDLMCGGSNALFRDIDPHYNFQIQLSPKTDHYLYVDNLGRRFMNEKSPLATNPHTGYWQFVAWDEAAVAYTHTPYWVIFDSVSFKAGPLGPRKGMPGLRGLNVLPLDLGGYAGWSSDNVEELNKGWIRCGSTIEELAANIKKNEFGKRINADNLTRSVERYNELCAKRNDDDFGRPVSRMLPVNAPPYYAFAKVPGGVCTHGGPRRSAKAEVLNPEFIPIPRLFAAGELGSIYGRTYSVTGGNLGEATAFGRIAGRNAAEMIPWC